MTIHTLAMDAFANFESDPFPYDVIDNHFYVADSHHKLIKLTKHFDPFRALEVIVAHVQDFDKNLPGHLLCQATALVWLSCGWTALTDGCVDGVPSQHPMRRRYRLVVAVNTDLEMTSVLEFEDDHGEILVDRCHNHSPIMDAVKATMEAILAYQKNLALRK